LRKKFLDLADSLAKSKTFLPLRSLRLGGELFLFLAGIDLSIAHDFFGQI
jgi:hypothetical protein